MKNKTISVNNVKLGKSRDSNSSFFKSINGNKMSAVENSFFKPSTNFIQRKCAHCKEEERQIQKKSVNSSANNVVSSSTASDAIHSSGYPLDTSTKNFMESRFGHDFSNVQIHNDSLAHRSSSDIKALAYTHSNHIVFGKDQYQPNTISGKKLLAHELTHVIQQQNTNENNYKSIQRKINYPKPTDDIRDPIPLVLNSPKTQYLALTTMRLNGKVAKDDSIILSAFDPSNLKFTPNTTAGNTDIDNSNINLDISANRILWKDPGKANKWSGYYDRTSVPGSKTNCEGGPQMYVELKGKPDTQTIYSWIMANEDEHVRDLKTAGAALESYYDRINKRTLPSCTNQADCEKLYKSKFEKADKGIAIYFVHKWDSLVASHDNAVNGNHNADSHFLKNDCDRAVLETAKQFP